VVSYPRRDEVWLIALVPSQGSEVKKTRPCLVVSPNEMNESLQTTLVAPMTTTLRNYPMRLNKWSSEGKLGRSPWINCAPLTGDGWIAGSALLLPGPLARFRAYWWRCSFAKQPKPALLLNGGTFFFRRAVSAQQLRQVLRER